VLVLALGPMRSGRADPAPPQVNPIHLQREDSQRLRELQRTLERQNPAPVVKPASGTPAAPGHASHVGGYLLLSVTAVAAVSSLPFLTSSSSDPSATDYTAVGVVLLVGAGITGVIGVVSLAGGSSSNQASLQLRPALTPSSVGLALTGRL
jgi:hypothetical protein